MRALTIPVFLVTLAIITSSCSQLMGNLRRDLDDTPPESEPTTGGRWVEGGQLDNDRFMTLGHSDRSPASLREAAANARSGASWVDSDQDAANRRDLARDADADADQTPSYANTPDMAPPTKRLYKNGSRATRSDFLDESPNEGSLWASDGQTNYYFTKNKVRGVGDIVTVNLEADLVRDVGTEVKRGLNEREKEAEMSLAQDRANQRAVATAAGAGAGAGKDSVATSQAAPVATPGAALPEIQPSDIDVAKSLELKAGDTMMAEITDRYPNGNYKIRGTKRVVYKNGPPRMVNLVGVVRAADIGEDDVVNSGKLYEYRLEATK